MLFAASFSRGLDCSSAIVNTTRFTLWNMKHVLSGLYVFFQIVQPACDRLPNLIRSVLLEIMEPWHDHLALRGPAAAERMLTRLQPAGIALNV